MVTWLTGGGAWQPEGSSFSWWGEHRAILPYPLPRPRWAGTHGRHAPAGATLLLLPDGATRPFGNGLDSDTVGVPTVCGDEVLFE